MDEAGPSAGARGRQRVALAAVCVAWGALAIVTQSLLLREAMTLMSGSELAWGVVFAAWLLGVAIGGAAGGRWAAGVRRAELPLAATLLLAAAMAGLELWLFRGARAWLGVGPGELLPLPLAAAAAMVLVTPASLFVGAAFPLACRLMSSVAAGHGGALQALGGVYALESTGSLIGGAAFSFWAVEHLTPVETLLLLGALVLAACATMLASAGSRRLAAGSLGLLAAALVALACTTGNELNRALIRLRFGGIAPGYELLAETDSRYQNLMLAGLAGQYTLYCDGQATTSFPDPFTFAPLAHFWMCEHPAPRRLLLIGGGAEGLLPEILRHPVQRVDFLELDARLLGLVRPYLDPSGRQALTDPRVRIHHEDVRRYVKTTRDTFDLVIARLPEPTSALRARLLTADFFGELRRVMTDRSVLCLSAAATPGALSAASAEYLASLRATLATQFPEILVTWGNPAHVLAATAPGLLTRDSGELAARYERRHVRSPSFDPLWFEGANDWLDAAKLRQRARELDQATGVTVATDARPLIYIQRLILVDRMTGGQAGRTIEELRRVGWRSLVLSMALVAVLVMLAGRRRGDARHPWARGALWLSVASTGFTTMALSLVALFAFQNLYGYVYQRVAWIVAVFMAGLVIGSGAAARALRRAESPTASLWRLLFAIDLLLGAVAALVPHILAILGRSMRVTLSEWALLTVLAAVGALGGAAFAVAGALQLEGEGVARASARIVTADHAGACVGALLTGLHLVPILGVAQAAYLLAGMKIGAAGLLAASWRGSGR